MKRALLVLLVFALPVGYAAGHGGAHKAPEPPAPKVETLPAPEPSAAHRYFGDIPLVDQHGRTHRLYSDLIAGRIVVIDFMYTECGDACPMMSSTFEKIQTRLGDRVGKDVLLLSFSVDPKDTPAKLKEYAARFHAGPGWYFLTGDKANVEAALRKLGGQVEKREGHTNLFILGNEPTGLWKKAFGLADPAEVMKVVDSVVNDRG
jgi:protein SCO1